MPQKIIPILNNGISKNSFCRSGFVVGKSPFNYKVGSSILAMFILSLWPCASHFPHIALHEYV